jgi:tryptophanyl-tRNA synthetase
MRRVGWRFAAAAVSEGELPAAAEPEQTVTPWAVECKGPKGIDYDRVTRQFKSSPVDAALVDRLEAVVNGSRLARAEKAAELTQTAVAAPAPYVPHHFFRRGIAFSHRDLGLVLDDVERRRSVYLYTGRGPSANAMHVGHLVPFLLTKHLQDALRCPLVIQITDDEKFLFRGIPFDKMAVMVRNNIKDIIAFGFDPAKTFIFKNTEYMGSMYPTVLEVQRHLTANAVKNTLGFTDSDSVGKYAFAATQAAPCFASAFPAVLPVKTKNLRCLVPCAIDQDPFFILTRAAAERIKRPKPALLHTKFVAALKGATHKMSSSAEQHGTVLLTDTDDAVRKKMRSAYSGGRGTLAELQEHGADLDADVPFQTLRFFQPDDAALAGVAAEYGSGRMSSAAVKELAADAVIAVLRDFRERRAAVTDADVEAFCTPRNILF